MRTLAFLIALIAMACDRVAPIPPGPPAVMRQESIPDGREASMSYLLRNFQAASGAVPLGLAPSAPSMESLVARFLAALERGDAAAIESLRVTQAEFAYLYFPASPFMRAPYELDPAVLWLQIDAESRTGLRRVVRAHGGRALGPVRLDCRPPDVHGPSRIHGCDVAHVIATGDTARARLFGAILERGGTFKFLSLQNRL